MAAGLDFIALAVAHLEQQAEQEEGNISCRYDHSAGAPPPRSIFEHSARRVSDSTTETSGSSLPPPATIAEPVPHQDPTVSDPREGDDHGSKDHTIASESVSAEVLAAMIENLSEEEFTGPPPPAPAPTDVITQILDMDVLCGRGGETNHHSGNVKYRSLVKRYQPLYIISKRRDKPKIAEKIVKTVRHLGGRFLKKDAKTNTWRDVGNTKAREKTSQALREGAPDLRSPSSKDGDEATTPAEQQPQQQQLPPPQQLLLGQRMFAEYNSPSAGPASSNGSPSFHSAGPPPGYMGHTGFNHGAPFYLGRSRVGTQSGDLGDYSYAYPPFSKKMRMGLVMPPHQLHAHARMGHAPAYAMPMAAVPLHPASHQYVSPSSFAATVSADSDESEGQELAPSPVIRGPRLKLLKKRLQNEQSS